MRWLVVVTAGKGRLEPMSPGVVQVTRASLEPGVVDLTVDLHPVIFRIFSGTFGAFLAFHCDALVFFSEVLMHFLIPLELAIWAESILVELLGELSSDAGVLLFVNL